MNEILTTAALGVLAFFGVRIVQSIDAMKEEMHQMRLTFTEKFVTEEKMDAKMDELEESIMKDMEMCALRNCGAPMKEVV